MMRIEAEDRVVCPCQIVAGEPTFGPPIKFRAYHCPDLRGPWGASLPLGAPAWACLVDVVQGPLTYEESTL